LSKPLARRFLLAHQHLLPPRRLSGKAGILHFIQHIGCIQFDPIDVVGRNPELVLQARVRDHRPQLLQELLYTDRLLVDGWDKLASIYLTSDWPYFARHRTRMRTHHGRSDNPPMQLANALIVRIRREGPLSSIDVAHDQKVLGGWGRPTRLVREAFEILNAMGELGVHHRVGTRRFFDLNDRLIPAEVLARDDPHLDAVLPHQPGQHRVEPVAARVGVPAEAGAEQRVGPRRHAGSEQQEGDRRRPEAEDGHHQRRGKERAREKALHHARTQASATTPTKSSRRKRFEAWKLAMASFRSCGAFKSRKFRRSKLVPPGTTPTRT